MRHKSVDLVVVLILTITTSILVQTQAGGLARAILVIPYILVLPGWAMETAFFARQKLDLAERIVLILGLSIAITILVGLSLHWSPWGLSRKAWSIAQGSVIVAASLVAALRHRHAVPATPRPDHIRLPLAQQVCFGLAALLVVAAMFTAYLGAIQQTEQEVTQLWAVPVGDAIDGPVRIGIWNLGDDAAKYELRVTGQVTLDWPAIEVEPGKVWETVVSVPTGDEDSPRLEACLYRLEAPETIYRRIQLW